MILAGLVGMVLIGMLLVLATNDYYPRFLGLIVVMFGVGTLMHDLQNDKIEKVKSEYRATEEVGAGYYKVHFIREEEDKSLTTVIENSDGKIRVVSILKEALVGWNQGNSILRVYVNEDIKLYKFMDAIE